MGTPLSDATEERQWRKLVHRATFVRNRKHKQAPQNQCRLCGREEETIMHLFRCEKTKPLWKECISFCTDTLDADPPTKLPEAIIFNIVSPHGHAPRPRRRLPALHVWRGGGGAPLLRAGRPRGHRVQGRLWLG
eukprot:4423478-Prymnesium_polylepis.1